MDLGSGVDSERSDLPNYTGLVYFPYGGDLFSWARITSESNGTRMKRGSLTNMGMTCMPFVAVTRAAAG
jgi:hypothetical protein